MKIFVLTGLLLFSRLGFPQGILESYKVKTDSLNKANFEKFKTQGSVDTKNKKTGFWTEYELVLDSVKGAPVTVQVGDTSTNLEFPNPTALHKKEGDYKNGLMHNQWKWFRAIYDKKDELSWEKTKETEFTDGKKNGVEIQYNLFEAVYKKSTYVNGLLDGYEYIYPSRDVIRFKILYKKGVEQIATTYFKNGNPEVIENYEGPTITKITKYHENGQVLAKYALKGGELDGEAMSYDAKGNLIEKKHFKNGVEVKK